MGTRNLTMVISNGETKVAQYGQWDGYPDGQGSTILEFLRNADLVQFKELLENVRFISNEEIEKRYKALGIKSPDGWLTMEQAEKFKKANPQLDRDMAAEVLQAIYQNGVTELNDSSSFAGDSLFCEWAYVVDLDKMVLEVYKGFNQKKLTKKDRFFYLQDGVKDREDKYYPVKIAKTYQLNSLPTKAQFIKECTKEKQTA